MECTGRAPAPNDSQSAWGACQEQEHYHGSFYRSGLDSRGAIVAREKVSRRRIASRLANLPPCLIGIEAGMATHYVARELAALGHDVKQVPPTYAKPFRQGHKNDFRDAHAVAEAFSDRRRGSSQLKQMNNWICKRCTGYGLALSASEPQ